MHVATTIAEVRHVIQTARQQGLRIALVPTMGNLHEGHLALVHAACQQADVVVASIFVNPIQFGPNEDFDSYPRTLEEDKAKLEKAGCTLLFTPEATEIYPNGQAALTQVRVPEVSQGLCAGSRPEHFDGVSTVVSILFHIVWPDVAFFGNKDYQQLAVIRRMVADQHMPIQIVGVDTVRESNGLALSSRNGYLTAQEKQLAARLQQRLKEMAEVIQQDGEIETVLAAGRQRLAQDGFILDYLECRATDLSPVTQETQEGILLTAAWLGKTRLLDNLPLTLAEKACCQD